MITGLVVLGVALPIVGSVVVATHCMRRSRARREAFNDGKEWAREVIENEGLERGVEMIEGMTHGMEHPFDRGAIWYAARLAIEEARQEARR